MAAVTAKRREKRQVDQPSDAWLWPTALLLIMAGWGQALWIGERTAPKGLAPLWLLLWAGIGVAGCALPIYWFARRWPFVAWVATAAWVLVPSVYGLAGRAEPGGENWLYGIPLLLLLLFLLGAGLSGATMTVAGLAQRLWPGPAPKVRPLREGLWAGLFAVICGWLLSNGAFALVPAALLASALILIETFFVIRESPQT